MILLHLSSYKRSALIAAAFFLNTPLVSAAHSLENDVMPSSPVVPLHSHDTLLSFTTQGEAKAIPSQLTIHFSAHTQSTSPATAQKNLNQMIQKTAEVVKNEHSSSLMIGNYNLSQEYSEHSPRRWTAEQNLTLKGGDNNHLLVLAEKLQSQGLALESMNWSIDPQTKKTLESQARSEALKKVRTQAESDASALGLRVVNIERVQIGNDFIPEPRMGSAAPMMMSLRSSGPSPQSTPEEQTIRVSVSAHIRLASEHTPLPPTRTPSVD